MVTVTHNVRSNHVRLLGEDARREETPHAREVVHGRGVHGVVDLHLEAKPGTHRVPDRANGTDEDRGPGLDHRTGRGDAHKAW